MKILYLLWVALTGCLEIAGYPLDKTRPLTTSADSVTLAFVNSYWHKNHSSADAPDGWPNIPTEPLSKGTLSDVGVWRSKNGLHLKEQKHTVWVGRMDERYGNGVVAYHTKENDFRSFVYTGLDNVRLMQFQNLNGATLAIHLSQISRHKGKAIPRRIGDWKLKNGLGLGSTPSEVQKAFGKPLLQKMYRGFRIYVYAQKTLEKRLNSKHSDGVKMKIAIYVFKNRKMVELWHELVVQQA